MQKDWPELNFAEAGATYETVQLWTQIVGKIKLKKLPWINHSWHVTLFVIPAGLTTGDIVDGNEHFEIEFNFIRHELLIITSSGHNRTLDLHNLSVASFYFKLFEALDTLDIHVEINPFPNELEHVIPFYSDEHHATYNPEHMEVLHSVLLKCNTVFYKFRAEFCGKCSPVHFFWGSFDLAVSRFSGKEASSHPGGVPHLPDWVAREAYSHEVSSCGFWSGNKAYPFAMFYCYFYPEPAGYKMIKLKTETAFYHPELREFILPYATLHHVSNPSELILDFLHETYNTGADMAGWNRKNFEEKMPEMHKLAP